ncbi:MAG TPA: hypothetical protein PLD88_00015 [Candidatus Berkiella sp.]|nr:hypothetical protein [Candidatus Berkiella sp.]
MANIKRRKRTATKRTVPAPVVTASGTSTSVAQNAPTQEGRIAWLRQQLGLTALIKATITLGILGFIPGAWIVGLPVLCVYGLIKREKVTQNIRRFFSFRAELEQQNNAEQSLGERTADFIITYYAGILRWFATAIMFFTMPIGFGLIAGYGLLRFTTNEWLELFERRARDIYDFVIRGANRFLEDTSIRAKFILGSTVALLLGTSILLSGFGILLTYSIAVCQVAAVLVGCSALIRDLDYAMHNPGRALTANAGKMAGTFWGYSIASQRVLFSRLAFFTNIFLPQSMQIQGYFYGIATPLPMISMMLLGCLAGYAVEKFVDSLCNEVAVDSVIVTDASARNAVMTNNRFLDAVYRSRWGLAFITGATPVIVSANVTSSILLELAGGSLVGATALTVAGLALGMVAMYGLGMGVRSLWMRASSAAKDPKQPSQPSSIPSKTQKPKAVDKPAKTFMPAHTQAKASKAKTGASKPVEPRRSSRLQKVAAAGR